MNRIRWSVATSLAALIVVSAASAASPSPLSVGDQVRFAQIGDPRTLDWSGHVQELDAPPPALFSPDGSHVAVVVGGGDPVHETNNASLLVFVTAQLLTGGDPIKLAEFASATNYQPIAHVRWLPDNETLVFAGTQGGGVSQVYRVSIRDRTLEQLTHFDEPISWFDIAPSGRRLLALNEVPLIPTASQPACRTHGCLVTATRLIYAESGGMDPVDEPLLVVDLRSGEPRTLNDPLSQDETLEECDPRPLGGISSDGRYLIRQCKVRSGALPAWWGDYTPNPMLRQCMELKNTHCFRRNVLIDLETGESRAWTDAPAIPSFQSAPPIWIDGGRRVILPIAAETLSGTDAAKRTRRASAYVVQVLEPATGKATRIGQLAPRMISTTAANWDEQTQVLTIEGRGVKHAELPPAYFQRKNGRWIVLKAAPASPASHARLIVEQSLNDPPRLVAIDDQTSRKAQVLDPNPWLKDRTLGRVEAISWRATDGRTWTGGLYYPPDYKPEKRYPILFQTHGFAKDRFSLYGIARNFPGQALAAHGIMVLQIDENEADEIADYYKVEMWARSRAGYEGAIDELDARGLIDRSRVGTVGWSATGPTTATLMTHSDYPVAAAAFTDSGVFGYWYNMMAGNLNEKRLGGSGFGAGLAGWLEYSPTFNFDRLRTPLLMWGAGGVAATWDWYVALKTLKKPVEQWSFAGGTHDIYQASQRLKGNQLLVDWFVFWLKGEERREVVPWGGETAQSLADQYTRWRELRTLHEADLKKPRPPLLKWTATPLR